jgi:hypothetical protein
MLQVVTVCYKKSWFFAEKCNTICLFCYSNLTEMPVRIARQMKENMDGVIKAIENRCKIVATQTVQIFCPDIRFLIRVNEEFFMPRYDDM